jgi:hypothetical protein
MARYENPYDDTEHPVALWKDKTLIGYGREGHGLNGKDGDLLEEGQIVIHEAWLFAESVRCVYSCYATFSGENGDEYNERAQPYVASLPGFVEWDGDEWVATAGPFTLEYEPTSDETDEVIAELHDMIEADDFAKVFATEVTSVYAVLADLFAEMSAADPQFYLA